MFPEIRLSALILTVLISIALVVGLIHYAPPLTQTYYWRLGGLIAGAGLLVTLFDRLMAARARRREIRSRSEQTISRWAAYFCTAAMALLRAMS